MSEILVPMATGIISLLLGWYLRGKDEREKNKRETIREFYPPLLDNIKDTMSSNEEGFYNARGIFPVRFIVLDEMINDGTIKIIEACDKELYNNLMKIESEIIPLLSKCYSEQRKVVKTIEEKWINFLNNLAPLENFQIKTTEFVHQLTGLLIWDIWRKNYESVRRQYVNFLMQERIPQIIFISSSKDSIEDLILIAETEMDKVKNQFEDVKDKFKDIIDDKIIPRMENTIQQTV